jgi:hypothetical protein
MVLVAVVEVVLGSGWLMLELVAVVAVVGCRLVLVAAVEVFLEQKWPVVGLVAAVGCRMLLLLAVVEVELV